MSTGPKFEQDEWVESQGRVVRILRDDNEGSRHQRFILRITRDHTILIAHNIDLAKRVPVELGDWVRFRGEYEWSPEGGIIHWTHSDPGGYGSGGWIMHKGVRYR